MKGKIVSVNISEQKGEKKRNIGSCFLLKGRGLEGDAHAGFMHRQVSLLAMESVEKIRARGLDVKPGDFAENLTEQRVSSFTSCPWGQHSGHLKAFCCASRR